MLADIFKKNICAECPRGGVSDAAGACGVQERTFLVCCGENWRLEANRHRPISRRLCHRQTTARYMRNWAARGGV